MPLINCEVSLTLTGSKNCVITDETTRELTQMLILLCFKLDFQQVPHLKQQIQDFIYQFKGTIKWSNYRSEISNQTKTDNLNYLIDSTFRKVNRLSMLSFKNKHDDINDRIMNIFQIIN